MSSAKTPLGRSSYGIVGSISLATLGLIVIIYFPNSAARKAAPELIYEIATGVPLLIGFYGVLAGLEGISKIFADRSIIDSYVIGLALGSCANGLSYAFAFTPLVYSTVPLGANLATPQVISGTTVLVEYSAITTLLLAEALVLFWCLRRVGRVSRSGIFVIPGIMFVVAAVLSPFIGSYLYDAAWFSLVPAFFTIRRANSYKKGEPTWDSTPKAFFGIGLSRLWFTEEGILEVRTWLGSVTYLVLLSFYVIGFVAQTIFQSYDISGNLTPVTTSEALFLDFVRPAAIVLLLVASRSRYPRLSVEDVEMKSILNIPRSEVSKITLKGTKITVESPTTQVEEATLYGEYRSTLKKLLQQKIGDKFIIAG